MDFAEIIDALPFADFATAEEMAQARILILEELGSDVAQTTPVSEQKFPGLEIDLRRYEDFSGDISTLKRNSEILESKSENLEISSRFSTPAWIQLKVQLGSLKEKISRSREECEEAVIVSTKRRRLAQTIQASSLGQLIREWSEFVRDNGEAEKAVAKLQAEIQALIKRKKISADIWEEINQLVILD